MNKLYSDVAERAGVAFLEGTLAGVTITALSDRSMWLAAVSGGIAAALSVLKSTVATRVGDPSSASLSKKI